MNGKLVTILQISDSAFPTGGFSHSVGLEAAIKLGIVNTTENFKQFTVQCMENAGSFSLPYVTAAYHSCMDQDRLTDLDSRCQACLNNHVANRASIRQGNSLIVTAAKIFPDEQIRRIETLLEQDRLHGHYAVMFGFLSAVLQLDLHQAHQMFVFGVLRTIIASAVRLGNVGTIEAQRIQFELQQGVDNIIRRNLRRAVEEACVTFPLVDITQNTHDTMFAKLFHS
ncbi:urease accessory protein F-like [Branchiostoma floridae]|uniref:Urease accessory protein F-like n=1 Tax=Branchiostoma floridae TaxID=7739 RepID=A0A9J7MBK0_BRAFL|nr:urease accessory protein F-like [Branchiostoma floridae]